MFLQPCGMWTAALKSSQSECESSVKNAWERTRAKISVFSSLNNRTLTSPLPPHWWSVSQPSVWILQTPTDHRGQTTQCLYEVWKFPFMNAGAWLTKSADFSSFFSLCPLSFQTCLIKTKQNTTNVTTVSHLQSLLPGKPIPGNFDGTEGIINPTKWIWYKYGIYQDWKSMKWNSKLSVLKTYIGSP